MHDSAAPTTPPDPTTDPLGALEREVRVLIRRAQSTAAQMARLIHPELDASAYPLLAHIAQYPNSRGSDLAAHFGVGRATVSRQLSRMADLGLVHRETDPEDTRGQCITLTDDGVARFEHARDARIGMLEGALASWSEEDIAELATLLRRYSADVVRWLGTRQGEESPATSGTPSVATAG
ncbi:MULTISPECIES: MarR family winged helix-turn-helix transcriptional regulator [Isoptericola]|uniref:MarR family transcriptional regulator n=1 Tax=Isoptericola sediminis TaxID=2733572 RepID=A0A849K3T7_9MICO|nr:MULTISPECIES: MarR family transcriptional regulator [Isoptericola]MDO8143403.1 MarR family transcriptional regulator [Isoptericola sp. 178]MDO8147266.1 MarR family transcriptional regulator [Isoptericola sp. b515]MDO8150421.1 MarR family transcriptional regulator [Isoptericola sp. b408]NNU27030.1 MarR family transcriptional regulator [Isoptericola sediminis]